MKDLLGIHHVTAITSSAEKIYHFYTQVLGIRLVKKNVNQDDLTSYHLFFADDQGSPGTDMTFFDFKNISANKEGTNSISRTSFRVPTDQDLNYWLKRFIHYGVKYEEIDELFGKKVIYFEDFDQQQYLLISDENDSGVASGIPWKKGPVPNEFAITGLGPIFLRVRHLDLMQKILREIMLMRFVSNEDNHYLFEMGEGGNGASIILIEDLESEQAVQGYGGVHHVAFRVKDKEHLLDWKSYFEQLGLHNSGHVDRFYFESVYIRLYPNILFELATDGPGFIDDQESYETLGETLTLPPHLRHMQSFVEHQLQAFDTVWTKKETDKEYF